LNEYIPDLALKARAFNVAGSCYKFSEKTMPGYSNITFFHSKIPPRKILFRLLIVVPFPACNVNKTFFFS